MKENNLRENEISSGEEAWHLVFMFCSQNSSACKWNCVVLRGTREPAGLGSTLSLSTPSHETPGMVSACSAQQRRSAWTNLYPQAVPPLHMNGSRRASPATQTCCEDKHVSDCIYSDINVTKAREEATYRAFRYTAPVCKAGNEHSG